MGRPIVSQHLLWLLLGAGCFFVAQPLLRIPLLYYIQGTTDFALFSFMYPVITIVLISFSAGLFEETSRFLFKTYFLKPIKSTITQPILFGLGHGIIEACLLLVPLFWSGYSVEQLWLGLVERGLAILLHIALTVIVWNGFQTNRRIRYLLAAIALHGFVNSVLVSLQQMGMSPIHIEGIFAIIVILALFYVVYSNKFYIHGGQKNEPTANEI